MIDWPGNSPDLNPIENAWNQIKTKLQDMQITSIPTLKEAIKDVWENQLTLEY